MDLLAVLYFHALLQGMLTANNDDPETIGNISRDIPEYGTK